MVSVFRKKLYFLLRWYNFCIELKANAITIPVLGGSNFITFYDAGSTLLEKSALACDF
jgi:hypothetical protein